MSPRTTLQPAQGTGQPGLLPSPVPSWGPHKKGRVLAPFPRGTPLVPPPRTPSRQGRANSGPKPRLSCLSDPGTGTRYKMAYSSSGRDFLGENDVLCSCTRCVLMKNGLSWGRAGRELLGPSTRHNRAVRSALANSSASEVARQPLLLALR